MISSLDRKLLRDLVQLKGQVLTIALVVACGIAAFVIMRSTWASLEHSKNAYYERQRFADVFARLESAPEALALRARELPGVASVQTRVVERVTLPLETLDEPISADLVSLPPEGRPRLNDVYVTTGRRPERPSEVLLLQAFADAHGLGPGSELPAVINGRLRQLEVSGTALAPEYVFGIPAGDMTVDDRRFAVLWMSREEVAPAYRMEGAFNDLSLALELGASVPATLQAVDDLIRPYGGLGAIAREKQLSHFTLEGELAQLKVMATALPAIFLGVAAFLLNVVLARLVNLQRAQIATLKAIGYSDREVALHYLKLVMVVVLLGAAIGILLGAWGGKGWTGYYGRFFKFPTLRYGLDASLLAESVLVSLLSAVVGALASARRIQSMPPAEAMRPAAPPSFRATLLERAGVYSLLGPSARMVAREVERRPLRTLLSSLGIAMAVGILVVSRFWSDAVDFLVDVQFHQAMREDLTVNFIAPRSERAVRELGHLPGVLHAEGLRAVPVRFHGGHRHRDAVIWGYPEQLRLRSVLDRWARSVRVPDDGVMLTDKLAEILGVAVGDLVSIEFKEGQRRLVDVPVSGLVDEAFGLQGHANARLLHRWMREQSTVSQVLLRVDEGRIAEVQRRLKRRPGVASVTRRGNLRERFEEQSGAMMLAFTFIATLFATIIAVGVVYNNARVALSMRSRDLASLRVLGFTRAEISRVLLGELSIQVLLAVPLGLAVGTWLAHAMMSTVDPETYRMAVVISAESYAFATVVTLAAGLFSALIVRRKLDRLDLIGVLKTRE